MKKKITIGIVGCGAIGTSLALSITRDFSREMRVSAVYDTDTAKKDLLSKTISMKKRLSARSLTDLIDKSDLVIEASSARCSWDIAQKVLKRGRDIMIMSIGGVLPYYKELSALAKKYARKVYLPSGALSGIDGIKASSGARILSVTLTTTKHPLSFTGNAYVEDSGIDLKKIKKDTVLFSGNAQSAVKYFPQNINVAAIVSIAGIGPYRTKVRIVASPASKRNIHEVAVESAAGKILARTENLLHPDNPKTSYLAVLSAYAALKQIIDPVKIGT
ncbi:MAG: aspartate dehydrogenase [Candidatus Omnitrophota bacterium]